TIYNSRTLVENCAYVNILRNKVINTTSTADIRGIQVLTYGDVGISEYCRVSDNDIITKSEFAIHVASYAIDQDPSKPNNITRNITVENNIIKAPLGIRLQVSTGCVIKNNTITTDTPDGFSMTISYSEFAVIESNTMDLTNNAWFGVGLEDYPSFSFGGTKPELSYNSIVNNTVVSDGTGGGLTPDGLTYGFYLYSAVDGLAKYNTFLRNEASNFVIGFTDLNDVFGTYPLSTSFINNIANCNTYNFVS
ncbi:unnamed protein product, partial [marine sediment metagenome]